MGEHDEQQDPREEQIEEIDANGVTDLPEDEQVTEVDEEHVNRAEGPVL